MRKYKPARRAAPAAQKAGEYCTAACGNTDCRVNLRRCQKGERFTVRAFWGSERCRGYVKGDDGNGGI